jgi:hypothetical protein
MGELIGNESTAENLQALAIRSRFKCAVVDGPNELGADEDAEIPPQARGPSYAAKHPIGPVRALQRHPVILHERTQQRRMTPLFSNQQVDDRDQVRHLVRPGEAFRRSQERPSPRLFPELKRGDGARDELRFVGRQDIGKVVRYPAGTQGVMLEMIQPDLEISRTHAATLPIAPTLSVRVHSGIPVREFGQIVAAARDRCFTENGEWRISGLALCGRAQQNGYSAEPAQGRSRLTDRPPFSRLASWMRPPCASAISRASARPMPVPLRLVE